MVMRLGHPTNGRGTQHDDHHRNSLRGRHRSRRAGLGGRASGRPARRQFSTEYKRRILAEYDAAPTGSKGLVLRREGLYDASVKRWRTQLEAGTLGRMSTPKPSRGKKTPEQQRIAELERQVAKLEAESAKKDKAIANREEALEVLGKGVAFLEALSKKDQP